jgi:hypothetical protein
LAKQKKLMQEIDHGSHDEIYNIDVYALREEEVRNKIVLDIGA